jgi:hypothetical protein
MDDETLIMRDVKPIHQLQDITYTLYELIRAREKAASQSLRVRLDTIIDKIVVEMEKITEKM